MTDLPIVAHCDVTLDAQERERLRRLASDLRADEPALWASAAFGPRVSPGLGPWPSLVIEDHSGIALFEERGDAPYAYRALLLAGDGDLVVIAPPRCPRFEDYCRSILGLGQVEIIDSGGIRQAAGACSALCERCSPYRRRGGLGQARRGPQCRALHGHWRRLDTGAANCG